MFCLSRLLAAVPQYFRKLQLCAVVVVMVVAGIIAAGTFLPATLHSSVHVLAWLILARTGRSAAVESDVIGAARYAAAAMSAVMANSCSCTRH